MCSIGAVFTGKGVYVYKQCDLTSKKEFYEPEVRGQWPNHYIAMTRQGRPGLWAGVNQQGVCFVAADAYTNTPYDPPDEAVNELFAYYEAAVAKSGDAREAANILEEFYLRGYQGGLFPGPDIALFADPTQTIFIEYTPGKCAHEPIREVVVNMGHFASANHFRIQPDAVDYEDNHSTYLRLARAEAILEDNPTHEGVMSVLVDQYYGLSELSICRVTEYPGEYFTQATALLGSQPGLQTLEYQINGNPIDNPLKLWESDAWPPRQQAQVAAAGAGICIG